jgi:hypothetical protein
MSETHIVSLVQGDTERDGKCEWTLSVGEQGVSSARHYADENPAVVFMKMIRSIVDAAPRRRYA